jgi:hypothetical protein
MAREKGEFLKSMREQRTKSGGSPARIDKTYYEMHCAYIKIRRFMSTFIFGSLRVLSPVSVRHSLALTRSLS